MNESILNIFKGHIIHKVEDILPTLSESEIAKIKKSKWSEKTAASFIGIFTRGFQIVKMDNLLLSDIMKSENQSVICDLVFNFRDAKTGLPVYELKLTDGNIIHTPDYINCCSSTTFTYRDSMPVPDGKDILVDGYNCNNDIKFYLAKYPIWPSYS